jgi:hypothetical protein
MRARAPYTARLDFVCPEKLAADVATAAALRMQSINSWLRMACAAQLREQHETEMRSDGAAVVSSVGLAAIEPQGGRAKSGDTGKV